MQYLNFPRKWLPVTGMPELCACSSYKYSYLISVPPEAPTITISPPRDPIAPAAQPFTLPCGVQGNPAPIVRWHVGEALLVTGERLQVWENGSLHFTALREEDAGTYTCSAANVVGVAVSDPVVITVAG